ncbi:unnamed protein product [Effrenium voratum]|uniref:Uncharacterized protein n=1 Tax=Effrenium voratum TaxID=2562239 RepID=A0AA36MQ11_9DINO|nr:unnamed protein product [Effrenium voratum]
MMTQYEVQAAHWLQTMKSHQEEGYLKEVFPIIFDLDNLPMLREISATQRFEEIGYVQNHEEDGGGGFRCLYHWELVTAFDGRAAGDFVSHLDALAKDCAAKEWQIMHILSVTVAILAVISILLIARKIRRSVRVISAFRSSSVTWAQLSAQDIASMLSIWWAMALASNFVQLVAAVECLRLQPEIGHRFMWVGFSCFLTWMNMIQYFESFPSYFIAFHTIAHSGMRILQLFFSVAPLLDENRRNT